MNLSYIAGYLDGEGSLLFGINHERREWKKGASNIDGWVINPSISVTSFDREVLKAIKDFLENMGFKVYKLETKKQRLGQTQCATRLSLFGWHNVARLIRFLLPVSISKKPQYLLYKDLYHLWKSRPYNPKNHYHKPMWTKETFIEAMGVVDQINSLKSRHRGKYNTRFFNQLWRLDSGN